jgi:Uma2 family endonuclease
MQRCSGLPEDEVVRRGHDRGDPAMSLAPSPHATPGVETPPGVSKLYEVVDGVVVEPPPMGASEVWIASSLSYFLADFVRKQRLGRVSTEMLYVIDRERDRQRRPDLSFVSFGRWPADRGVPSAAAWDVVPDLAVEVVSPTDLYYDVMEKLWDYIGAGVRLVWIIYPPRRLVYVYRTPNEARILHAADELDGGDVLPGFSLGVASLFDDTGGTAGA